MSVPKKPQPPGRLADAGSLRSCRGAARPTERFLGALECDVQPAGLASVSFRRALNLLGFLRELSSWKFHVSMPQLIANKGLFMKAIMAFLLVGLLSGCATVGTLQPGSGGSTFEVRGKAYDEIWKASVRAMTANLTIVESDNASGTIKSEARTGMTTWGEVVGLFIRPTSAEADRYTVEVQSLKRLRTQITGQNWEPSVIANIKAELGI